LLLLGCIPVLVLLGKCRPLRQFVLLMAYS
jgi:hypothetical protein